MLLQIIFFNGTLQNMPIVQWERRLYIEDEFFIKNKYSFMNTYISTNELEIHTRLLCQSAGLLYLIGCVKIQKFRATVSMEPFIKITHKSLKT